MQALSALSELLTATPPEEMDTLCRYWLLQHKVQCNCTLFRVALCLSHIGLSKRKHGLCISVDVYAPHISARVSCPNIGQSCGLIMDGTTVVPRQWHVCRALTAVGTLSMANKESKQLAQDLGVLQTAHDIQQRQALESKLKTVVQEVVSVLTS